MNELFRMKCVGCRAGEPRLTAAEIRQLSSQVPEWRVRKVHGVPRIERTFAFKDFAEALAFANRVGLIAEEEGHHPVIITEWGKSTVAWWTHKIRGLHRNDFIMASKTDLIFLN